MWDVLASGVLAIPALLLIVDPLAAVPVFLALTTGESPLERRAIARRAAVTAGLVLAVFALAGGLVFRFFGITLGGFQIAGGLLLLRISLDMLAPRPRPTPGLERPPSPVDVSLIPLAVPLLAGPGAITTVMVLTSRHRGWVWVLPVLGAIAVTMLLTWLALRGAQAIESRLSRRVLDLLGPLLGLLLAAIAIEFTIAGVREVLHPPGTKHAADQEARTCFWIAANRSGSSTGFRRIFATARPATTTAGSEAPVISTIGIAGS